MIIWKYGGEKLKLKRKPGTAILKGKEGPSVFCKRWGWEDFQGWWNSLCKSYRVMGEESSIRKPQTVGRNPEKNRMERRSLKKFQCKQTWRGRWKKGIHTEHLFVCALVAQSCPALCDPVDCSPAGSSVHGILQARILEWVAILFPGGSSWPRDRTLFSCIAGRFFTIWATREAFIWYQTSYNCYLLWLFQSSSKNNLLLHHSDEETEDRERLYTWAEPQLEIRCIWY